MAENISIHDRAIKGGLARKAKLTSEERSASARNAANRRWGTQNDNDNSYSSQNNKMPTALFEGILEIADIKISCANLDDGTRVLSETQVASTLGRGIGGKTRRLARSHNPNDPPMPTFLSGRILEPFVPASLRLALANPKEYLTKTRAKRSGVDATLLNEICSVWVEASQRRALQKSQEPIADRARTLLKGMANVGITLLVDAATGYDKVRDQEEIKRIVQYYVTDELLPWSKRFPEEYYRQVFRLLGWAFDPGSTKRGKALMKWTEKYVYDQLPPGVYEEIKRKNPANEKGLRRHKNFQWLSGDIGNEHLKRQVIETTTIMKVSRNKRHFKKNFTLAFSPREGSQLELQADEINEEGDEG